MVLRRAVRTMDVVCGNILLLCYRNVGAPSYLYLQQYMMLYVICHIQHYIQQLGARAQYLAVSMIGGRDANFQYNCGSVPIGSIGNS